MHIGSTTGEVNDLTPEEVQLLYDIRRRKNELLAEIQQLKDEISNITSEMGRQESQEECKNNGKQKQLSIGRKRFNMDPKKGIEYLIEHQLLQDTAEDVAQFLYKGDGLNKTAIGDYLGEKNDFNMQVLDSFIDLHDFTKLLLVQALRQFLWSFRLPGESQKIDRMMEKFALRYCQQNEGVFSNEDTCYVLSFSIIMLNTALHNPSVKEKPTLEKFIQMNRGINNGGDLPRELLISLYESIKQEPFKIPEDDGNDLMHTFFNPDREGWLWKQGGRYKTWKRRWFILNDKCLYYFEYTTDKEPRGRDDFSSFIENSIIQIKLHPFFPQSNRNHSARKCSSPRISRQRQATQFWALFDFGSERIHQGVQDRRRRSSDRRSTHRLSNVGIYQRRERDLDQVHSSVHQSQPLFKKFIPEVITWKTRLTQSSKCKVWWHLVTLNRKFQPANQIQQI